MRIALFADIHSNLEALQACMRDARRRGVDRLGFLGDLVGYNADPVAVVETIARARDDGAIVLRGNHDEALAHDDVSLTAEARAAIDWTRARLSGAHLGFLHDLPLIERDASTCFVHASADRPEQWTYIHDDLAAARSIEAAASTWCFCGHVHDQVLYYQGAGRRLMAFRPSPGVAVPVGRHRRWLGIVGAVGQSRDGNTAAAYAIFDSAAAEITYQRVPYEHHAAADKVRAAGLPHALALRLENGR